MNKYYAMTCPSCRESLQTNARHCPRCGLALTTQNIQIGKIIYDFGWVARRAIAGLCTSAIGWVMVMAITRAVLFTQQGASSSQEILNFFPGYSLLSTAIAACCIGTVAGIMERSAYKALLGGCLGALGGALGIAARPIFALLGNGPTDYSFTLAGVWMIVGALVGLTSGLLEGSNRKMIIGVIAGIIGGMVGGGVGAQMYGATVLTMNNHIQLTGITGRLLEAACGGIVGVNIWFAIGLAEKFYIFKRREMAGAEHKVCDACHHKNVLRAWYCAQCGIALQVAASRQQMQPASAYGVEQISNAFHFLSWLFGAMGVILAAALFILFLAHNFLFAFFSALMIGLGIYILCLVFGSAADFFKIGLQKADPPALSTRTLSQD